MADLAALQAESIGCKLGPKETKVERAAHELGSLSALKVKVTMLPALEAHGEELSLRLGAHGLMVTEMHAVLTLHITEVPGRSGSGCTFGFSSLQVVEDDCELGGELAFTSGR